MISIFSDTRLVLIKKILKGVNKKSSTIFKCALLSFYLSYKPGSHLYLTQQNLLSNIPLEKCLQKKFILLFIPFFIH
jgi:hypothetical protein